jgi:hypothetical protein
MRKGVSGDAHSYEGLHEQSDARPADIPTESHVRPLLGESRGFSFRDEQLLFWMATGATLSNLSITAIWKGI